MGFKYRVSKRGNLFYPEVLNYRKQWVSLYLIMPMVCDNEFYINLETAERKLEACKNILGIYFGPSEIEEIIYK